jgi:hypothetical protein
MMVKYIRYAPYEFRDVNRRWKSDNPRLPNTEVLETIHARQAARKYSCDMSGDERIRSVPDDYMD